MPNPVAEVVERLRAYRMVRTALKNGGLVRPAQCQRCGNPDKKGSDGRSTIQAHHADYSKPLDVEWICSPCHRLETPKPSKPGGISIGSRNGQSKLTDADVLAARALRRDGWSYQRIADRFSVDKMTALRCCKGVHWKHVPEVQK